MTFADAEYGDKRKQTGKDRQELFLIEMDQCDQPYYLKGEGCARFIRWWHRSRKISGFFIISLTNGYLFGSFGLERGGHRGAMAMETYRRYGEKKPHLKNSERGFWCCCCHSAVTTGA